jgi:hypothetical protein
MPHLEFLHNATLKPKGAGYWFWKAPLLLHHLNDAANTDWGDVVIYADVDLRDHCKWLMPLIQNMLSTNTTMALYQVEYRDRNYTKRDAYEYYCGASYYIPDDSRQYAGGWLVVRKTPGTMQFLQEWQEGLTKYELLNDSPSVLPNVPGFDYHLHDQSLLSMLLKCRYTQAYEERRIFEGAETLKDWQVHLFQI